MLMMVNTPSTFLKSKIYYWKIHLVVIAIANTARSMTLTTLKTIPNNFWYCFPGPSVNANV